MLMRNFLNFISFWYSSPEEGGWAWLWLNCHTKICFLCAPKTFVWGIHIQMPIFMSYFFLETNKWNLCTNWCNCFFFSPQVVKVFSKEASEETCPTPVEEIVTVRLTNIIGISVSSVGSRSASRWEWDEKVWKVRVARHSGLLSLFYF